MKHINNLGFYWILIFTFIFSACHKKKEFLDEKPSTTLVVPTTLSDMQMLLDNSEVMNLTPTLGELGSDDYYYSLISAWENQYYVKDRNSYIWAKDIYEGSKNIPDWNTPYEQVFYANTVLEGLAKINPDNANNAAYDNLKGTALFSRGFAFYNLVSIFSPQYDSSTAQTDLGIPIRLTPDVTEHIGRSSVQEAFSSIIADIKASILLLPLNFDYSYRNRPSKLAGMALLARIYLNMGRYDDALLYADSCLEAYNKLIDYNTLSLSSSSPLNMLNDEVIYQAKNLTTSPFTSLGYRSGFSVDTLLYGSYDNDDLRKFIFYTLRGTDINVKSSYSGSRYQGFSGIATNELYLIRAECYARLGNINMSLEGLNILLKNRWKAGLFQPIEVNTASDALSEVLNERRKELIFHGLRWTDLRRLNKEGYNITLQRNMDGEAYELAPNSPLYVLPIPPDEISLSGIQQNIR